MSAATNVLVRDARPGLLWLITGCWMLQPLSTDLYLASLPHLSAYYRVSPAMVQQTLSLFALGVASAQLIGGPLSDRYGRRPVLLAGAFIYVLASLACTCAPSMPSLIVARFAQAVGCCSVGVVARSIVRDAYSTSEAAHVIVRTNSFLALALLASPIVGAYFQMHFGWRTIFLLLTAIGTLLAVGALLYCDETNQHRNPEAARPRGLARNYTALLGAPAFWAYALPGALSYASIFVFTSGGAFVLIEILGVSTESFGYCSAFGILGYVSGTLVCRRLLRRIGIARSFHAGSSLALAAGLFFATSVAIGWRHWSTVVLAQFLVTFAHGINSPCVQTGAIAPFPEKAGTAAALLGCLTMLTAFALGTLVGTSHDGTLFPLAFISAAVGIALFTSERLLAKHRAT